MKIYIPYRRNTYIDLMTKSFQEAGCEVARSFEDNDVDFVYFGLNFEGAYKNVPDQYKTNSGLHLTDKEVLHNTLVSAGLNHLDSTTILDENTIRNFSANEVYIKPLNSTGSLTPYTFVYKTFTSKDELIQTIHNEAPDFFSVQEDGSSICSKHLIQTAILPDVDGYVRQYYVPVYINGQGNIVTEGFGKINMRFNDLNDIDDVTYPLRNMRDPVIRNTEDQTDRYNILGQLTQLVDYCQIRNTPMHTQWLVDADGDAYLIDLAFQFQRGTALLPGMQSTEFMIDKIQYVYDMKPTVELSARGWIGMIDLVITSDKTATLEYAKSVGLLPVITWAISSNPQSLTIPFSFNGTTEQECWDKINLVKNYISSNTPNQ